MITKVNKKDFANDAWCGYPVTKEMNYFRIPWFPSLKKTGIVWRYFFILPQTALAKLLSLCAEKELPSNVKDDLIEIFRNSLKSPEWTEEDVKKGYDKINWDILPAEEDYNTIESFGGEKRVEEYINKYDPEGVFRRFNQVIPDEYKWKEQPGERVILRNIMKIPCKSTTKKEAYDEMKSKEVPVECNFLEGLRSVPKLLETSHGVKCEGSYTVYVPHKKNLVLVAPGNTAPETGNTLANNLTRKSPYVNGTVYAVFKDKPKLKKNRKRPTTTKAEEEADLEEEIKALSALIKKRKAKEPASTKKAKSPPPKKQKK